MKPPPQPRAASVLPALFLLSLCACHTPGRAPPAGAAASARCEAYGAPHGEQVIATTCKVLVLTETVCVYDGEGRLRDVAARRARACLRLGSGQ